MKTVEQAWHDTALPAEQRVAALMDEMTLEEKAAQVGHTQKPPLGVGHRLDRDPGKDLPRLTQWQQVKTPGRLDSQPG